MATRFSDDEPNELVRLRRMEEADVTAVMAIETRAYEFSWSAVNFHDCLRAGYYCRLLEDGGELHAYVVMSVGAGEAHILNLCVRPESRGRGYARIMLSDAIEQARRLGAEMLFLEVRPSNEAARGLYEKFGFNEISVRKRYYPTRGGREDALLLARQL